MLHLPLIPDVDEELVRAVSVLAADAATIHAVKNDIGVYTGTVEALHCLVAGADGWGRGDDEVDFQRRLDAAEDARIRLRRRLTAARLSADPFPIFFDH